MSLNKSYQVIFLLTLPLFMIACQQRETTPESEEPQQVVEGPTIGVELSSTPGVSIERLPDDTSNNFKGFRPNGSFVSRGTLFSILTFVGPKRLRDDDALPLGIYDVAIDPPKSELSNDAQIDYAWQMLVKANEESFQLSIRPVTREEEVLVLKISEEGLRGFEEAAESLSNGWNTSGGGCDFRNNSLSDLAIFLSDNVNRFVVNETEDTKNYDFRVEVDIFSDDDPKVWSAALETVGLDFHPAKREMSFTLIEKVRTDE